MDTVKQRIENAVKLSNSKSRRAFCVEIGIPYDTVNRWIDRENIPANGILAITSKVPISRTYLETGTGSPELTESGVSDYMHEDRIEELIKMYKEIPALDQQIIYQMTKRCWLTRPSMEF